MLKEINNKDINKNFLGVFPSDKINKFIMFEKMMPGKKYPSIFANTDRSDEGGTHWWSILKISPKSKLLLFDSFGISGMRHFIVANDKKKIVGKVLKGLELADQRDNKLTLVKLKFSMASNEKLTENEIKKLSETAQDLYHLIYNFRKNENITIFVNVWMLKDPIQEPKTVTCSPFQLYFYENLFFPDENSKLHDHKKLTNIALETLLNELFTLVIEQNEKTINEHIRE